MLVSLVGLAGQLRRWAVGRTLDIYTYYLPTYIIHTYLPIPLTGDRAATPQASRDELRSRTLDIIW